MCFGYSLPLSRQVSWKNPILVCVCGKWASHYSCKSLRRSKCVHAIQRGEMFANFALVVEGLSLQGMNFGEKGVSFFVGMG